MKHHLERLWQVWWARWHQTWGCWTLLKQNPLHFKLSRFLILQSWFNNVVLLLQEVNWCMEVICHGLCLPLEDHLVIRSISSIEYQRKDVMCVSLFQGLCQHLLRVALGPSSQSKTLCPEVDLSRICLQLDHWRSNYFQARSGAAKLVRKKDSHTFQPPFSPKKGRR